MSSACEKQLRVVIVGAGFCGLTAAIECKLRGMHPILVEAYTGPSSHGDLLDFVGNAGRIFMSWDDGQVGKRLFDVGVNAAKWLDFYNQDNVFLRRDSWPQGSDMEGVFAGHRGEMHRIVYEYAQEINVELQFGKKVIQYLDSDEERGVIIEGGEKIIGDVLLACDGPRSLARQQLLNLEDSRVNSGYAIYRAFFTVDERMTENPYLKDMCDKGEDMTRVWIGPDMHGFIYVWKNAKDCAWVLTHLDGSDIGESWSFPATKAEIFKYLKDSGFPKVWDEIVNISPEDRIIDYKLVWRDPLKTWLSSSKRCAVMGDAAHCHLPTSAQGASQAVEDAAVVALCLQKANGDVPLALQVFERIRYNRSHTIHQASISTRDIYHKNNWTPQLVNENPNSLTIPLPDWVVDYDCQRTTEENFDRLAAGIKCGKLGTIEELALPAGGSYDNMDVK